MDTLVFDKGYSTYLVNQAAVLTKDSPRLEDIAARLADTSWNIEDTSPFLKWIGGDFVEADRPNDNTQFWTAGDLELSEYTIRGAPLNMIHRWRDPVGYFASTKSVKLRRDESAKGDQASMKIQALSAMWTHLFPMEADVVDAASDAGLLFYCVDDQTELMTGEGWKRFGHLSVGEPILTLNRETGLTEWLPVDKVHRFDVVDTEMIRMEGQQHSSLTTPNHRWWVHRRGTGYASWAEQTSATLTNGAHIPRAMPHGDYPTESKYSDDFVELVAWCWTDAGFQHGSFKVCQSQRANPANVARIDALMARLGLGEHRRESRGCVYWNLHVGPSRAVLGVMEDRLPTGAFLRSLTRAQLELFVQVSILADGTVHKDHGQVIFYAETEAQAKAMEMACALLGQVTNTTEVKALERKRPAVLNGVEVRPTKNIWRVCLVRRSNFIAPVRLARLGKGFEITRERYTGTVWCPQTSNQTFLARRRGTVYWSKNSMECRGTHLICGTDESQGLHGCGQKFDYMDFRTHCEHLLDRTSVRHIVNPTFRGGALIVPPVRPGWKNANASVVSDAVMAEAAAYAERHEAAYTSHAGEELSPSEWEGLMSQVIQLTRG